MAYNPFLLNQAVENMGQGALQRAAFRQQQQSNALTDSVRRAQLGQMQRQMGQQQGIDRTLAGMFSPQRAAGTGPVRPDMMPGGYQPGRMETPTPSFDEIRGGLAQFGVPGLAAAEKFRPAEVDAFEGLDQGYETFLRANQIPNSPQAYQAYQRNVLDQKRAGASRVSQTVGDSGPQIGTIPPGWQLKQGPEGAYRMEAIPGGPVEAEREEQAEKERGRKKQTARAGGTVIQDLQRALNIVKRNRTAVGAPSIVTQFIPETDAKTARGHIESALSNVGLDTLQQMRENSPTGGALGQVPIQQQKRLEQVLGSLDLAQKPEVVKDNLRRVINIYMDIVHGTPSEIQQAVDAGKIKPKRAQDLMFRHPLSFDEFGRPIGSNNNTAPAQALEFLRSNPTPAMQQAFREKYGYMPEGF